MRIAADPVVAGEGGDRAPLHVRGAHVADLRGRHGGAAPALRTLGLGGAQSVVGQFPLKVALEFAGGGEGLHHELHGGQQRVTGGEIHGGERAVVDAQREAVAVQDVEHVEDAPGAAYEAEHLGDVHDVARPRVRQQLAELRALEPVKAGGGARVLLEDDRLLDPGLAKDEVLPGGGPLVGRDPLVDQVRHREPLPDGGSDPVCRQTLSALTIGSDEVRAAANPWIARVHWAGRLPVVKRWRAQAVSASPLFRRPA